MYNISKYDLLLMYHVWESISFELLSMIYIYGSLCYTFGYIHDSSIYLVRLYCYCTLHVSEEYTIIYYTEHKKQVKSHTWSDPGTDTSG